MRLHARTRRALTKRETRTVDGVAPVNPVYHVAAYLPNREPDTNTLSHCQVDKKNEINKKRFHARQGTNKHPLIDQAPGSGTCRVYSLSPCPRNTHISWGTFGWSCMACWEDDDPTSFEVGSSKNKKKRRNNGQVTGDE